MENKQRMTNHLFLRPRSCDLAEARYCSTISGKAESLRAMTLSSRTGPSATCKYRVPFFKPTLQVMERRITNAKLWRSLAQKHSRQSQNTCAESNQALTEDRCKRDGIAGGQAAAPSKTSRHHISEAEADREIASGLSRKLTKPCTCFESRWATSNRQSTKLYVAAGFTRTCSKVWHMHMDLHYAYSQLQWQRDRAPIALYSCSR